MLAEFGFVREYRRALSMTGTRRKKKSRRLAESPSRRDHMLPGTGELDAATVSLPSISTAAIRPEATVAEPDATEEIAGPLATIRSVSVGRTWADVATRALEEGAWVLWALIWFLPYGLMLWLGHLKSWGEFGLATGVSLGMVVVGLLAKRFESSPKSSPSSEAR